MFLLSVCFEKGVFYNESKKIIFVQVTHHFEKLSVDYHHKMALVDTQVNHSDTTSNIHPKKAQTEIPCSQRQSI